VPDNIPQVFYNNCLGYPIAYIFQLFCDNSFLPEVWRQAYVTSVFKKVMQHRYVIIDLLIQKTYQFMNVVNGVSHSHKTANIFFSFDSVA